MPTVLYILPTGELSRDTEDLVEYETGEVSLNDRLPNLGVEYFDTEKSSVRLVVGM